MARNLQESIAADLSSKVKKIMKPVSQRRGAHWFDSPHHFPLGNLHGFAEVAVFAAIWIGFWWFILVMWCSPGLRRWCGIEGK